MLQHLPDQFGDLLPFFIAASDVEKLYIALSLVGTLVLEVMLAMTCTC